VIALKDNQPTLREAVETYFTEQLVISDNWNSRGVASLENVTDS